MNPPLPTPRGGLPPVGRLPLLVLGIAALIVGVGAGLARIGVPVPDHAAAVAAQHGPLLIGAFFGTVIALERAVAIGRLWAFLGPLASGCGGVALISGHAGIAPWLLTAGGVVLLMATLDVLRRQPALFTLTLALGALPFVIGTVAWSANQPLHAMLPWWLAFLVLTIAGERLELSRLLPPSPVAIRIFVAILVVFGVALTTLAQPWGPQLFGAALLALALWLAKQDVARRTVRGRGLTRFIAVCLLAGYAWLAVAGVVMLATGLVPGTRAYDAALHALLLGFVFSMVFGHAPIIFPAILRVKMPWHPSFYIPLALLAATLALRLAGDASGEVLLLRAGAIGNAVALAAFLVNTVAAILRGLLSARDVNTRPGADV